MPDLLEPADKSGGSHPLELVSGGVVSGGVVNDKPELAKTHPAQNLENRVAGGVVVEEKPAPLTTPPLTTHQKTVLLFDAVSKWYGPVIGVNQVTLELRPGITGLVGANGSGKSTLMRLATGQLRPDLGTVRILGHDAWEAGAKQYVGYSPDVDSFYEDMSGRQFV